ncbi:MAG: response regulator, partial [Desulfobacteraceae bacterium]|nr:response regulator [Desulfobacteraceae bacterium]
MEPEKNIFIIDDEPEILMAVETCLRMAGKKNIITLDDSRDVMAKLEKHPPCLVILDLNMPHINGEKILKFMAADYPDIPVIILTGTIDVDTAVRCMKTGALDYVVKPVEEQRLLAAVDNALAYYKSKYPEPVSAA